MKGSDFEQNFNGLKQRKIAILQETNQGNNERMINNSQEYSSGENKQQFQNRIFQIKTLDSFKQAQIHQRSALNYDNSIASIHQLQVKEEKIKVEVRYKKKKKGLSADLLFQKYYSFLATDSKSLQNFCHFQYISRRNCKRNEQSENKIDLGVYDLREVVNFCLNKKLISNEAFIDFIYETSPAFEDSFLEKINKKQFEQLKLYKLYFVPFDHRLLCQLLVRQFPQQFVYPQKPLMQSRKTTVFYTYLYSLAQQEYQEILEGLNIMYCRTWMPNNFQPFQQVVQQKMLASPVLNDQQSFPFHLPPRKLRKKN